MRGILIAPIWVALVSLSVGAQTAMAEQKTAKQCTTEWAAEKAAIQASGKSRPVFMRECRGLLAPGVTTALPPLDKGQYRTEAEAKTNCPADEIVWVNLKSRISHTSGSTSYGNTKRGAYMCQTDSAAAGFRSQKNTPKAGKPA